MALLIAAALGMPAGGSAVAQRPAIANLADLSGPVVATPADIYGSLFRAVQMDHVFADASAFPDAVPRRSPGAILADYQAQRPRGSTALRRFVLANFAVPSSPSVPKTLPSRTPLLAHIAALWPVLTRSPQSLSTGGSALPLPRAYVMPGGTMRDAVYWDSYFAMLGLARDQRDDLVESMIDDFTTLIERYGHIPASARTYDLSRSQPPVYYLMLGLSRGRDAAQFRRRLAALRREHDYWMQGEDGLAPGRAQFHVVRLADGTLLNRYWDTRATPRENHYAADVVLAAGSGRPSATVYRNIRAAAESGWDSSSRWFAEAGQPATVRTTDIAPVDLNSLLYGMERMIAIACSRIGDAPCTTGYAARANARAAAIRTRFWDARGGRFADLDWRSGRQTPVLSAATLAPLFTGAARPDQARAVAETVRRRLLAPGGLRTTAQGEGQRWDSPTGWAPLQWIAVEGLRQYGEAALARSIAGRWLANVQAAYRTDGRLFGAYDIERRDKGSPARPVTDGYAWTAGVTRVLAADYGLPDGP